MSFVIPLTFFDPPQVIDTSVTPIPASSQLPLQVIVSTGVQVGVGVTYNDTTGEFIGVYIGDIGQEILVCIIGNGLSSQAWGRIPPKSRISLRSMKNESITLGLLSAVVVSV